MQKSSENVLLLVIFNKLLHALKKETIWMPQVNYSWSPGRA